MFYKQFVFSIFFPTSEHICYYFPQKHNQGGSAIKTFAEYLGYEQLQFNPY